MRIRLAIILVVLTLSSASPGQEASPGASAEWKYSKQDDPLHGTSFDQFVLEGKYLIPPSQTKREEPSLVAQCSDGKLRKGFLIVGAVLQHAEDSRGVARSLKGRTQAHVEMRWDEKKKPDNGWWEISNDGQGLFFDRQELVKLMTGKLLGHPSETSSLVHRLFLGVTEAFGNQVVMQFDMPKDPTEIVQTCGLEWGNKRKR
jgi:hypothetical protein